MDDSPQRPETPTGSPGNPPEVERDEITKLVTPPAILMLVLTGLSILGQVIELVLHPVGDLLDEGARELDIYIGSGQTLGLGLGIFRLGIATVVIIGAFKMLQQRSWSLSMAAAILMLVPCLGPCCPLGIPVGIWALIILFKPEVRQVLERTD